MSTKVSVKEGGTGAGTLTGVLIGAGTGPVTGLALGAGKSIRRNAGDTAYEEFTPGAGGGTVTEVTSANTDATVATGTTTPVITIVSAPKLTTARTIGGTSFDGTANITPGLATTVTTNANLTGHITSVGNAAVLGSFTVAQLNTAISDGDVATGGGTATGTNTGDQTSIVGITGTMAQFDTAVTDGNFVYQGQALGTPSSGVATNLTGTASGLTAGNVTTNANLTGHITSVGNAAVLGSFTMAQLDTAVSDGNVIYNGGALGTPSSGVATNLTNVGLVGTGIANVTVGNTTTETALATVSIPANTLGTTNAVRITLFMNAMTSISEANCQIRLKYGSTTIATADFYNNTGGTIAAVNGTITAILYGGATTSAQEGVIQVDVARTFMSTIPPVMNTVIAGTAAEDSTGALNLVITAQWSGANASNTITMVNYLVEKIR